MPKNTTLVLSRDYTLSTAKGHMIEFKKGEKTYVPSLAYADALAIGALPPDDADEIDLVPTDPTKTSKRPIDPKEALDLVKMAVVDIRERNDSTEFTAAGAPKVDAVSKAVGFNVSAKEIQQALDELAADAGK